MPWPAFWKAAATIWAANEASKSRKSTNKSNVAMNYDFAQNSIQWKTEDAKKAGIHPLYAMGASTMNPSFSVQGGNEMGEAIRDIANKLPSDLEALQKKNIEADIALKMARASEVAKRTQSLNSQQDSVILEDNPKPRKELHSKRQDIKTIIGGLMPDKSPGYIDANRIPERYGDEAKDILGLVALWNDFWRKKGANFRNSNKAATLNAFEAFKKMPKRKYRY